MPKFSTIDEYHEWCEQMVTRLYHAEQTQNITARQDILAKIVSVLQVREGDVLVAVPEEEIS